MNMGALKKMSKSERLQAMEVLRDSLLYEDVELDTPKWHEKILEDRKKMISNGKAKFISLAELRANRRQ